MKHRRLAVFLQYLLLLSFAAAAFSGCRGGGGLSGRERIESALPGVPTSGARATNAAFAMPLTVEGGATFEASSGARRDGAELELVSSEGEVEYALYCVNLLESSLLGLNLAITPAVDAEFWIGVGDFALADWQLLGPFTAAEPLTNLPQQHSSPDGNFSFVVAVEDGSSVRISSAELLGESGLQNIGYSEHMRPLVFSLVCMNCHNTDNEGEERFGAPSFVNFNTYELALENAEFANVIVQAEGMPPPLPPLLRPWQADMLTQWIAAGAPEGEAVSSVSSTAVVPAGLRAAVQDGPDLEALLPALPDRFGSAHSGGLGRPLIVPGNDTLLRSDDSFVGGEGTLRLEPDAGEDGFAIYSVNPLGGSAVSLSLSVLPDSAGSYFVALADYAGNEWQSHGPFTSTAEVSLEGLQPSFYGNVVYAVVSSGTALNIASSSLTVERASDELTYNAQLGPLLFQSVCAQCHVTGVLEAGRRGAPEDVNFESYSATEPHISAALERVQAGEMPPQIEGEFLYPWQRELFALWAANGFAP